MCSYYVRSLLSTIRSDRYVKSNEIFNFGECLDATEVEKVARDGEEKSKGKGLKCIGSCRTAESRRDSEK